MNDYYVYGCYIEGVLRYVGMGKGSRYMHCTSGTSSSYELNRDHFDGKDMRVDILREGLCKSQAEVIESRVIHKQGIQNLYNKSKGLTMERVIFYERLLTFIAGLKNPTPIKEADSLIFKSTTPNSVLDDKKFKSVKMWCKDFGATVVTLNGKKFLDKYSKPAKENSYTLDYFTDSFSELVEEF